MKWSTTIYYVGKLKRFDFGDWWFLSMKPQSMFRNLKDPFCWEKERGRQKEGQGFKLSPENNLSWPRNWICVSSGCATCLMLHYRFKYIWMSIALLKTHCRVICLLFFIFETWDMHRSAGFWARQRIVNKSLHGTTIKIHLTLACSNYFAEKNLLQRKYGLNF